MADDRTPEQRAADETFYDALMTRLKAYDCIADDEAVVHFILAAHINGMELMDRNAARYSYVTRDGGVGPDSAPTHVLRGLVAMTDDWLLAPDED